MPIAPIGSRIDATDARLQRNFKNNQLDINRTLERLSTGLRINRAADDPVGITLAKKIETRLVSQRQAVENTQASTLVAGTAADGAQQVLEGLKRIRSLALQSLSDTTSVSDRDNLQAELKTIVGSIDNIARTTTFNQRNLLDGSSAGSVLFRPAESEILFNRSVTDTSTGTPTEVPFIAGIVSTDASISRDSVVEFRLFDSGADFAGGLEIRSSELGLITVTDNYLAFPNTFGIRTESLSGGPVVTVSLANLGFNQPDPISLAEFQNETIQELVDDRRIRPVSYGDLDLTLGGVTYNGVFNVQSNQTLEDVVNGLDGAVVGSGTLSASYDAGASRVTLSYSNQQSLVELTNTAYTPTVPAAAGGPVNSFAALGAPAEGPAYRDPDSFLPGTPFSKGSPPPGSFFPSTPVSLNSALDFSASNASVLSVFGLSNVADSGVITDYEAEYVGETVATGNQSEFVNRTLLNINSVTSENSSDGIDSGLTAADANTTFEVLNTAQVDVAAFGAGDFSIDFGANGVYTFAGFDPATDSIQDVVDGINGFAGGTGASINASFDAGSNQLTIDNAPAAKVTDPGFVAGEFTIDFGFNGTFDSAVDLGGFDPSTQTIDDIVTAINDFGVTNGVNVTAAFDDASDQLTIQTNVLGGGALNRIVFGGANGSTIEDFFNVSSDPGGLLGNVTVASSSDIDNSNIDPVYDITPADVTGSSLNTLTTPSGSNQIVFGGANGANIRSFFQLSDLADTGTGNSQSSVSAGDISSQSVDANLDIAAADVAGRSFEQLFTPKLDTLVTGNVNINGQNIININAATNTINDVVNAVNGVAGTSNRDYTASFDTAVAGGFQIQVSDTENLATPGSAAAADPSGANPQVNGNQITLDSAAFIADEAPLTFNSGTPLGAGSGPPEQLTFQASNLSGQYNVNAPDPSTADISGIQFSGSNIGQALFLQDAASGSPTFVGGTDRFRGVITATGTNEYNLAAEYQRDFSATSNTTSTRAIGFETPVGQNPEFGLVGEIFIRANTPAVVQDNSLQIQTGVEEGQTQRVSVNSLTASTLRLETLDFVGATDQQTRLKGLEALKVIDDAIETTLTSLAGLGATQRVLESKLDGLASQGEQLQGALSNIQDADIASEIGNLTRAEINVQAAAFALSERREIQERTFDLLLNRLGDVNLRGL